MASLSDLIRGLPVECVRGPVEQEIVRIVTDSRDAAPGALFVCLPGYRTAGGEVRADRHEFIDDAQKRGCRALLVGRPVDVPPSVAVVQVSDVARAAGEIARRHFGDPSRSLLVIGVTGTSGKTSTTYLIESVLAAAGHRVARFGTIEYRIGDLVLPSAQTTPEAPAIHGLLRKAVEAGCTAAVMEVSSHALALQRVDAVAFDVAVFTNLGHDHMSFHRDREDYLAAKRRLFEILGSDGVAVINTDDPAGRRIARDCGCRVISYGMDSGAEIRGEDVRADLSGVTFSVHAAGRRRRVNLQHRGAYSAYNALAALGVARALDIRLGRAARALASAPVVPGRFEIVDEGQPFAVAVDYAHKPDALAGLLESARTLGPRRILTVVGCGGDRDRAKRPEMARIAVEKSDLTILTSDNPRTESPAAILAEMRVGAEEVDPEARRHLVCEDRAAAIRLAIREAVAGDLVLIVGKGHETYQIVGRERRPFDDREQARLALRGL